MERSGSASQSLPACFFSKTKLFNHNNTTTKPKHSSVKRKKHLISRCRASFPSRGSQEGGYHLTKKQGKVREHRLPLTKKACEGLGTSRKCSQRVLVTFVRYKSDTLALSRKQNSSATIILPQSPKLSKPKGAYFLQ